jgi:ribosomal protein S1
VGITDRDVIVDINAKSEGVISLNRIHYKPKLKVDTVEVSISVKTKPDMVFSTETRPSGDRVICRKRNR